MRRIFLQSFLAAGAMALGFPPFGLWPLIFVAVYFLGRGLLNSKTFKEGLLLLGSYSFFVNILGFYWLAYLFHEFAELSWFASVPLALGAFFLLSIPSMLLGGLWAWAAQKENFHRLQHAALGLFLIFWDRIDYRFFPWSPVMGMGSNKFLMGSVGVLGNGGWRVLLFGGVVALIWSHDKKSPFFFFKRALPAFMALIIGVGLLGAWRIQSLKKEYPARQPVALLQGNIGNYQKKLSKLGVMPTVENVLGIHEQLLDKVYSRFSFQRFDPRAPEPWVFWPETAFPSYPQMPSPATDWLRGQIYRTGGLHFVGAYERDQQDFGGKNISLDFNTVALFSSQESLLGVYRKHLRIAFGEYIPLGDRFPQLYDWLPMVNHFGRGYEFTALPHPREEGPVFIPVVCYEILHEVFVRNFVAEIREKFPQRPLVLVNPTNDSWYGPTSEPFQHALLARWQSALLGLAMLRPTNTGLSQVIAPWGEVLAVGDRDESEVIFGELPVKRQVWRGARP